MMNETDANPLKQAKTQAGSHIEIISIGESNTPIIQISDFYPDPQSLVQSALSGESFQSNAKDFYPGDRKPFKDSHYQRFFLQNLLDIIHRCYPNTVGKYPIEFNSVFSITTTPAEKLRPIQTIPHIDTHDAFSFASVHYLCKPPFAGTSFYRHKSTGLERISNLDLKNYFATAKKELMSQEFTPGYCHDSNEFFACLHKSALKFNRLILYPANLLHSGQIYSELMKDGQPSNERLTLNSFVSF